jgi:mannose-6-phosphate isomerase-like protein (cupin superfamily)
MNARTLGFAAAALASVTILVAGATLGTRTADPMPSAIVPEGRAVQDDFEWGTLYTYFEGETYGTTNVLSAVAIINPGMEIHPPHRHTEEEILMVTEGEGTWHLNGETSPAFAGDILYAAPWDVHGITNTGSETLRFVVWKWDNKGMSLPVDPDE